MLGIIPIVHEKLIIRHLPQGICLLIHTKIRASLCPRQHDVASYNFFSNLKYLYQNEH